MKKINNIKSINMKSKLSLLIILFFTFTSCDQTETGWTTIQVSEQQEMQCPYCFGSGVQSSYYGPVYCSYCNGTGRRYNTAFRSKKVKTVIVKSKKCPTNSRQSFECIDDGIISSTEECIHCEHSYFVHK